MESRVGCLKIYLLAGGCLQNWQSNLLWLQPLPGKAHDRWILQVLAQIISMVRGFRGRKYSSNWSLNNHFCKIKKEGTYSFFSLSWSFMYNTVWMQKVFFFFFFTLIYIRQLSVQVRTFFNVQDCSFLSIHLFSSFHV